MNQEHSTAAASTKPSSRWISAALIVLLLLGGAGAAYWIKTSAPRPERVKPEVKARLVETVVIQAAANRPVWQAGGQVEAVERVALKPRVSGYVDSVSPAAVPGAVLQQGEVLATLDATDFRLSIKQAQAAVSQAKAEVAMRKGDVAVAEEEYALVAADLPDVDRALVLKQPQLEKAQATLTSQQAALSAARLNLQRATLTMPFDGQVLSRSVSRGSQVSTGTNVFELVNTDRFWVRVKVPATFLNWLDDQVDVTLSHPGWGGQTRTGTVVSRLPGVTAADRQAQVLVAVDDPLDLSRTGKPSLLLSDFVTVTLQGRLLDNTVAVPLSQLEDDDSIWVVNDGQLTRRELAVMYRGRKQAWVSTGFRSGDALLANRIDGAVEGLPVREMRDRDAVAEAE
ncbi:MAG: efflux RND transporter periplasmic adaptor subunit [Oceanobacter sp.]